MTNTRAGRTFCTQVCCICLIFLWSFCHGVSENGGIPPPKFCSFNRITMIKQWYHGVPIIRPTQKSVLCCWDAVGLCWWVSKSTPLHQEPLSSGQNIVKYTSTSHVRKACCFWNAIPDLRFMLLAIQSLPGTMMSNDDKNGGSTNKLELLQPRCSYQVSDTGDLGWTAALDLPWIPGECHSSDLHSRKAQGGTACCFSRKAQGE